MPEHKKDLLTNLGSKDSTDAGGDSTPKAQSPEVPSTTTKDSEPDRGDDLLVKSVDTDIPTPKGDKKDETVESKTSKTEKVEPSDTVKDPDSWSKDSAFKEIKKLRDENKAVRTKYQTQLEQQKSDFEAEMEKFRTEMSDAIEAKNKLEQMEAEQVDKKRSLEEKIAAREALVTEKDNQINLLQQQMVETQEKLKEFEAEKEAHNQVYKDRITQELAQIPEEFRDLAERIVGNGDPRDGWAALHEAKLKGLFEDKKIIVDHSVPGANNGARTSKEKLLEQEKERRSKLTPQQKIAEGLGKAGLGKSPNLI